ncbi:MAG: hypothetical protein LBH60_07360, partial [Prevotellaceae bacterium]|nr:hypothetical protein [Prevotellaceae bacterium]
MKKLENSNGRNCRRSMKLINFSRIFALALTCICIAVSVSAQFSGGGTGAKQDPYKIVTATDLDNVRNFLGRNHADKY